MYIKLNIKCDLVHSFGVKKYICNILTFITFQLL